MHGTGEGWLRRERADGASGLREWAARTGGARAARVGGASGRCSRVARKRSCADGAVLGKFRPQVPLGRLGDWGMAAHDGPEAASRCLGRSYGGLGGHLVIRTASLPQLVYYLGFPLDYA